MEQKLCATTILDLNNDCLGVICKLLTEEQQIKFALSCQRFQDIFEYFCGAKHEYVDIKEDYSEEYFQVAGNLIKNIKYHNMKVNALLIKYCLNLKSIYQMSGILDKSLLYLLKNIKSPRTLNFVDCHFDDCDCDEEGCNMAAAVTELKKSDPESTINCSALNTGKYVNRLEKLNILFFRDCYAINSAYFTELSWKQLSYLEIRDCRNVPRKFLLNLTKQCPYLMKLVFTCDKFYNEHMFNVLLGQLPILRDLVVYKCTENLLKALAEHASAQLLTLTLEYGNFTNYDYRKFIAKYVNLKELSINECHCDIRDFVALKHLEKICLKNCCVASEGIIDMLQKCPSLVYISVERNQATIGKSLLPAAIKLLSNAEKRSGPVKLRLAAINIYNEYLQTPEYLAAKHLLVLELLVGF